jgi:hypothetical protein
MVAVIVDGDILTLDSVIKDGAKVDVLTPLSGGTRRGVSDSHRGDEGLGHTRCRVETRLPALGSRLSALGSED